MIIERINLFYWRQVRSKTIEQQKSPEQIASEVEQTYPFHPQMKHIFALQGMQGVSADAWIALRMTGSTT
jgi:hypothetical protein